MPLHSLDETDKKILQELINDSRTPVRTIANKTNVSIGTVFNRIKHMEENGIIRAFTISVDYESLGFQITVMISIKIKNGKYPELANELAMEKNVITVYDVTGEYDGILISIFTNRQELDKFLKKLQSHPLIEDTHTVLVLNVTKESQLSYL